MATRLGVGHVLSLPIPSQQHGPGQDHPSPSSQMALKVPFVRQSKPQGTKMLRYPAPVSPSSASRLGCLTKYRSTSCPSCSAAVFDYSNTWQRLLIWKTLG